MQQVPYQGAIDIGCNHTKFSQLGNLFPKICLSILPIQKIFYTYSYTFILLLKKKNEENKHLTELQQYMKLVCTVCDHCGFLAFEHIFCRDCEKLLSFGISWTV